MAFQAIEPLHQSRPGTRRISSPRLGAGGEKPAEAAAIQPTVAAILAAEPGFLIGMDRVVSQYAQEATARIERLRLVELILLWRPWGSSSPRGSISSARRCARSEGRSATSSRPGGTSTTRFKRSGRSLVSGTRDARRLSVTACPTCTAAG